MRNSLMILFLIPICVFSQKSIRLDHCKKLSETIQKEGHYTSVKIDSTIIEMVFFDREKEYFSPEDTNHRDYINIGRKITIDSLIGLKQFDYTGAYDYGPVYSVNHKEDNYLIISFADAHIYGTDQSVTFVIFKQMKDSVLIVSTYTNENNRPTDKIRVVKKRRGLKLKGAYLKQN